MSQLAIIAQRVGGVALPRSDNHDNRIEIRSESSSRKYIVAQRISDRADLNGRWECSCFGWKRHRTCKHIRAIAPVLVQHFGGHQSVTMKSSGPDLITTVRRGPVSDEAKAKHAARVAHSFSDEAYNHYDPVKDGFGSLEDWLRIADELIGEKKADASVGRRRGRPTKGIDADLIIFGLTRLPDTLADLKKAFRPVFIKTHPDHGGSNEDFRNAFAASKRLMKNYT